MIGAVGVSLCIDLIERNIPETNLIGRALRGERRCRARSLPAKGMVGGDEASWGLLQRLPVLAAAAGGAAART